jgi:hypothetical protein
VLKVTTQATVYNQTVKKQDFKSVTVDSPVQEKTIETETSVSRVYRDIQRQLDRQSDTFNGAFKEMLEKTQRIMAATSG